MGFDASDVAVICRSAKFVELLLKNGVYLSEDDDCEDDYHHRGTAEDRCTRPAQPL